MPTTTSPDWTLDPEARALLASCAANPPRRVRCTKVYTLTTDEWFEFTGSRVERLKAIQLAYRDRALAKADAGDTADFLAWCDQPNAHRAIDEAIDAAALAPVRVLSETRIAA